MTQSPVDVLRRRLQKCLDDVARKVSADAATILVYDDVADAFDVPVAFGLKLPEYFTDPTMLPGTDRLSGRIVKERLVQVPIDISSLSAISKAFARREDIQSAMGFALLYGGRSMGVLFVSFRHQHAMSASEVSDLDAATHHAASAIHEVDPFEYLRKERETQSLGTEARSLRATAKLISQVFDRPAAIWLEHQGEYRVRAVSALRQNYLREGIARPGDCSLVSRTFEYAEPQPSQPLVYGCAFPYQPLRIAAGWDAIQAFPILLQGRCIGAIELFGLQDVPLRPNDAKTLIRFSDMVAEIAGSSIASALRSEHLVAAAREISEAENFSLVIQRLVSRAKTLTAAHSALFISNTPGTTPVWVSEGAPPSLTSAVPMTDKFNRQIISRDEARLISDTDQEKGIREEYCRLGVNSMAVLPVRGRDETIGLLVVNGQRPDQFRETDIRILKTLAAQVSTVTQGAGWLSDPSGEIDKAMEGFFSLNEVLDRGLDDILEEFVFDFASFQMIRPHRRTIETMRTRSAKPYRSRPAFAGHALDVDPEVMDIQADIATSWPPRIEVIGGWDTRFDPFIYRKWGHEKLVRIWVPIIMVRRLDGSVEENWQTLYHWKELSPKGVPDGWRMTLEMEEHISEGDQETYLRQVIGTIDAGWEDPTVRCDCELAERLVNHVGVWAATVLRSHLFPSALETIVRRAAALVAADSASLHYAYSDRLHLYANEVCSGPESLRHLQDFKPDHHSLGNEALRMRAPIFAPDPGSAQISLGGRYPRLAERGIKSVVALPLEAEKRQGVLYLYFKSDRYLTKDEMTWAQSLCNRATDAIRHFTQRVRAHEYAQHLIALHDISRILIAEPQRSDLLELVAGHARDILAADLVAIYEYHPAEQRFLSEGKVVGRLMKPLDRLIPENADSAPVKLINMGAEIYAKDWENDPVLGGCADREFFIREKISSVAAICLREHHDIVGVMFVNYRTHQEFSRVVQEIVRILAASAALAIMNLMKRSKERQALLDLDAEIAGRLASAPPDVQRVFQVILENAVEWTGAQAGYLMGRDPNDPESLVLKAGVGLPTECESLRRDLSIGIVGRAAREKKTVLVANVQTDPGYHQVIPSTRSELAVPIVAKDGLIGVINIEDPRPNYFSEDHRVLVETLAVQILVAYHSLDLYHRLDQEIRPLRPLARMTERLQEAGVREDRLLRLLLTGVTAEEGLAFSRAMVFLYDKSHTHLRGVIALGAVSQNEATAISERSGSEVTRSRNSTHAPFDCLLERAEQLAEEVARDPGRDSALSQAVKCMAFPPKGAVEDCLYKRGAVLVPSAQSDPFRDNLEGVVGHFPSGYTSYEFATMPLIGNRRGELGVLVVDNRFRSPSVSIDEAALERLGIYGRFIALSIESARTQTERVKAIRDSVNTQISEIGCENDKIERELAEVRKKCREVPVIRLEDAVRSIKTRIIDIRQELKRQRDLMIGP